MTTHDEPEPTTIAELPAGSDYHNEPARFWRRAYYVWLSPITQPLLINADNADEAIEAAFDYARQQGWDYDEQRDDHETAYRETAHPTPAGSAEH